MRIKLTILYFLLISYSCKAQNSNEKSYNTIVVSVPDSIKNPLAKAEHYFMAKGYEVDSVNEKSNTFYTKPRLLDKPVIPIVYPFLSIKVEYVADKHVYLLTGEYQLYDKFAEGFRGRAYKSKHEDTCNTVSFNQIDKLAKSFPQGIVRYEKKED